MAHAENRHTSEMFMTSQKCSSLFSKGATNALTYVLTGAGVVGIAVEIAVNPPSVLEPSEMKSKRMKPVVDVNV